jgi:hypothetical protein
MVIKVVTLTGLELAYADPLLVSIGCLKKRIEATEQIPVNKQRIIYQGQPQADEDRLNGDGLYHLVLNLRAGMMTEGSGRNGAFSPIGPVGQSPVISLCSTFIPDAIPIGSTEIAVLVESDIPASVPLKLKKRKAETDLPKLEKPKTSKKPKTAQPEKPEKPEKTEKLECSIGVCTTGRKTYFTCPDCGGSTCLSCFAIGMKEHNMNIECPSCKVDIPASKWRWLFPPHFVNTIVRKRDGYNLVQHYDANRSLFQDRAAAEMQARGLRVKHNAITAKQRALRLQMAELKKQQHALNEEANPLSVEIYRLEQIRDGRIRTPGAAAAAPQRVQIVRETPCLTADCRAFLDRAGHCNICTHTYCLTCQCRDHGDAPCNSDTISTLALIRAEYKPCPNPACGVPIKRVSGCSQMFCVLCHTFFDENTREISKGRAHNPEFFDLIQRGGILRGTTHGVEGAGGVEGCGMPNFQTLRRLFPELETCDGMCNFIRAVNHLVEINREDTRIDREQEGKIQKMLIDSILSEKAKTEGGYQVVTPYLEPLYRSDLVRCCKASQYAKDWNSLLLTTCNAGIDLIRSLQTRGREAFADVYAQVQELVTLTNGEITKLADFYENKPKGQFNMDIGSKKYLEYS